MAAVVENTADMGTGVRRNTIAGDNKRREKRFDSKDLDIEPIHFQVTEVNGSSKSVERPKSNGNAVTSKQQRRPRQAKFKHLSAVHWKSQPSCLSYQDTTESPDFWGFRNILILMLVVSNLRLMLENFRKYGILICFSCHNYRRTDVYLGAILYFSIPCHLFIAFLIEKFAARQAKLALGRWKKDKSRSHAKNMEADRDSLRRSWYMIGLAQAINTTANLLITSYTVYYHIHHPGIGTVCELHAVIVWMKVCSYTFANRDLRDLMLTPDADEKLPELYNTCPYPRNISISNLCYFWWAPTLVYQPVYPRTQRIRWDFVAKRFAEVGGILVAIWILSAQYAVPLLVNSLDHMQSLDIVSILERLLKLSTVSLFIWLAGFFAIFQSFLNGLAELTTFGDREFYADWWNAADLRTYWTTWNKPVSSFMKRHIYAPMVVRNVPLPLAQIIVFTFSGFLHELLVGIPTHNIIGVAFLGMLWQIPLIILTDALPKLPGFKGYSGKVAGNMIFWVTFTVFGQPLAVLLYFYAWQAKYGSVARGRIAMT